MVSEDTVGSVINKIRDRVCPGLPGRIKVMATVLTRSLSWLPMYLREPGRATIT